MWVGDSCGFEFSVAHINFVVLAFVCLPCLEFSSKIRRRRNFSHWKLQWPVQSVIKKNSMGNWELVLPTLIRQNNVLSGGRVKGPSPMEFPKQKVTPRALPSGGPCLRNSLGLGPYLGSTRIDCVLQCNFQSRKVIWVICIHRPK